MLNLKINLCNSPAHFSYPYRLFRNNGRTLNEKKTFTLQKDKSNIFVSLLIAFIKKHNKRNNYFDIIISNSPFLSETKILNKMLMFYPSHISRKVTCRIFEKTYIGSLNDIQHVCLDLDVFSFLIFTLN